MFNKKKKTSDEKIISTLDSIDKSVRNLRKLADRYNEYIDRAILKSDKKTADKYILGQRGILKLADMIESIKASIELGAYTSKVVASLGTLPEAISGCKGLLNESPNFKKVGDDLRRIFDDMKASEDEIEKLNDILEETMLPSRTSLDNFRENTDYENDPMYKALLAAAIARTTGSATTVPAADPISSPLETGNIDFAGLMAQENKKDE